MELTSLKKMWFVPHWLAVKFIVLLKELAHRYQAEAGGQGAAIENGQQEILHLGTGRLKQMGRDPQPWLASWKPTMCGPDREASHWNACGMHWGFSRRCTLQIKRKLSIEEPPKGVGVNPSECSQM